jgi:hypothetical protein
MDEGNAASDEKASVEAKIASCAVPPDVKKSGSIIEPAR